MNHKMNIKGYYVRVEDREDDSLPYEFVEKAYGKTDDEGNLIVESVEFTQLDSKKQLYSMEKATIISKQINLMYEGKYAYVVPDYDFK